MIYVLIAISLLFVAIGFIVTENNAKYLLSGYNTMSDEARNGVDIKSYIQYFRKFHIALGATCLAMGGGLTFLVGENAGGIFLGVYPILGYLFFVATSSKYSKGAGIKGNVVGIVILSAGLLFVIGLFTYGFKENEIAYDSERIVITGMYGETLVKSDVRSIELVSTLPEITFRTNGFALGTINKGYFKTNDGEIVKLILNSDRKPLILLRATNGNKIYYSSKNQSNEHLMTQLKRELTKLNKK
jgi:hypothetical protein